MKKKSIILQLALAASLVFSSVAYAATASSPKDIPIGGSGQMEMIGTVEPTILSVTMPSFVPFNISNSLPTQNKVISPRINVKNNSSIPVKIDVTYTKVDLDNLKNVTWSNNGTVTANQIAIGLKQEDIENEMPEDLTHTKWLKENVEQNTNVMILDASQKGAMYVVGTLGKNVADNATFNVTPTFVVSRTSN